MTLLEISVATDADDAYVQENVPSTLQGGTVLRAGSQNAEDDRRTKIGLRFLNVPIPQGTPIEDSKITFVGAATQSTATIRTNVRGYDVDDAPAITASIIWSGTRTAASVTWDGWSIAAGVEVDTPDIVAIIQEIIDRPGWVSGNDIILFVDNDGSTPDVSRTLAAHEHATYASAELIINFTPPPAKGAPIFFQ